MSYCTCLPENSKPDYNVKETEISLPETYYPRSENFLGISLLAFKKKSNRKTSNF